MPGGRPSLYRDEYVTQVRRLALLGLTDEEMASFFEVSKHTLYEWDEAHPEFLDSRARGERHADGRVAERLYHRALGYSHRAVKIFMPAGASEPVYADYVEHFPPDTQAASLWLRNRQPDKWKDRTEQAVYGDLNIHRVLSEAPLTIEEWTEANVIEPPDAT